MNNHQRPDPLDQASEFWGTIVLHRWGILFVSVALATVAIVVIALLPDYYVAGTTVLFDPQRLPEQYIAPTVTADPAQRLSTLTQQVLSVGRLQQISQQLHLVSDPRKVSQQEVVAQMSKNITIDMKPNSDRDMSAFVISYTGQDPQLVAGVANSLAQSFIDWDVANREQQAASTTQFMTAQLEEAKQTLDGEEAKVRDYKENHAGELPEQLQSNMQALNLLHVSLQTNREELDRLEQEKAMNSVPEAASPANGALSEHDRLENEQRTLKTEVANLRAQYTEQYPDVVATKNRLDAVTKLLSRTDAGTSSHGVSPSIARAEMIQREIERLQEEQKQLIRRMDRYQSKVDAEPLRGQEFDSLSRNYNNARAQYEGLLDKKFHAEMAMNLQRKQNASRFTVDPAEVPEKPIKPNRLLLLAMALPLCVLIPAGIAVGAAEIRGTVNSERILRSLAPSARVLGHIPLIDTPVDLRKRRRLAMLSILSSLTCCAAVALFLWGGTADHMRRNHAHRFVPTNPTAKLLPQ